MDSMKLLDDMLELFNSKDKISISDDINPLLFKHMHWEPLVERTLLIMSHSIEETLDILHSQGINFKCIPVYTIGDYGTACTTDFIYEKIVTHKPERMIHIESDFI